MDADTFGNLTMLASGVLQRSPKYDRLSGTRWLGLSLSGNVDKMRPATEISQGTISMPASPPN